MKGLYLETIRTGKRWLQALPYGSWTRRWWSNGNDKFHTCRRNRKLRFLNCTLAALNAAQTVHNGSILSFPKSEWVLSMLRILSKLCMKFCDFSCCCLITELFLFSVSFVAVCGEIAHFPFHFQTPRFRILEILAISSELSMITTLLHRHTPFIAFFSPKTDYICHTFALRVTKAVVMKFCTSKVSHTAIVLAQLRFYFILLMLKGAIKSIYQHSSTRS